MYYEESVIDGILHYRTAPDSEWESFSLVAMTDKHVSNQLLINNLRSQVDQLIADGKRVDSSKLNPHYNSSPCCIDTGLLKTECCCSNCQYITIDSSKLYTHYYP